MRDENLWPELDSDAAPRSGGAGTPSGHGDRPTRQVPPPARQVPPESAAERTDRLPPAVSRSQGPPPNGPGQHTSGMGTPETEAETTTAIPIAGYDQPTEAYQPVGARTEQHPAGIAEQTRWQRFGPETSETATGAEGPPHDSAPNRADRPKRRRRRTPLLIAAVLGLLAVLYAGDLLLSSGRVPRGVTVAGVEVGGLSQEAAEDRLRGELGPRLDKPVRLAAGERQTRLEPESSGLNLDWAGTLEQAGDQPLNPITRVTSFFTDREVGVVSKVDQNTLRTALNDRRGELGAEPREGGIAFRPVEGDEDKVTARAVPPRPGQTLRVDDAAATVARDWLQPTPVRLPVDTRDVRTTEQGVRETLEKVAKPAVAEPLRVLGAGADATVQPVEIAKALSFKPAKQGGGLELEIDNGTVRDAAQPQLAGTERQGRNAKVEFSGGEPTVRPGTEGKVVAWQKTLRPLAEVLRKTGQQRQLQASYTRKPPDVTTRDVDKLGIKEVIGEFSTSDFASDSGVNIRKVAEEVDGAIVKPGETFSLNGHTGPRTEAEGYVDAGIIEDGAPARAVGGGISQFATTLYNAAYFAGMQDAGHQEHSYYISRYPPAREATVYQGTDGEIDLAFTNDAETGVAIQTIWTPSDITVRIWGTKRYRVESITGDRKNFVPPSTQPGPQGECSASEGAPGFTTTDTRVLYDVSGGGEVGRNTRSVTYNPQPKIVCR